MGGSSLMAVVLLLGLVLMTSPSKAIDCMSIISSVIPCSNFLKNSNHALPETSCCHAARNWIDLGDVNSLCNCIQPIASQFLPTKARQLPGLCNLGATYSPLVKCLAPSFDATPGLLKNQQKNLQDELLPPLPLVPLPPLPPADEQNKKVVSTDNYGADGLLPPLPLFPLPPLPLFPLPPLPLFPLPPLPLVPLPPLPLVPHPPLPLVPPVEKHNKWTEKAD